MKRANDTTCKKHAYQKLRGHERYRESLSHYEKICDPPQLVVKPKNNIGKNEVIQQNK